MEEWAHKMSIVLGQEIDREILWSMLKEMGWTRVMLPTTISKEQAIEITDWLELNVKHPYESHNKDFIFENVKDATTFILRWAS